MCRCEAEEAIVASGCKPGAIVAVFFSLLLSFSLSDVGKGRVTV